MLNIMKNAGKILFKRKSYILVAVILPLLMTFLFTALYTNNSSYKIGIVNNDNGILGKEIEKTLSSLEGIDVVKLDPKEDNLKKLIFSEVSMIVTIENNYSENLINGQKGVIKYNTTTNDETVEIVKSILDGETKAYATLCNNINVKEKGLNNVIKTYRESAIDYTNTNKDAEEKANINISVGFITYLIFMSASMAVVFLLEDEREKTKDRILMGKVGEKGYYGAMAIVFSVLTAIPALEYYLLCKFLDFEIGFNNSIFLLILLLLAVLLAVMFNIMLTTIVKNKAAYLVLSSTLTIPVFMLGGAFWPFDFMSEGLQKIGSALPVRWFLLAIEKLQAGGTLGTIMPIIIGFVVLIILLFLISAFFTKNKIVLVKE